MLYSTSLQDQQRLMIQNCHNQRIIYHIFISNYATGVQPEIQTKFNVESKLC